MATASQQTIKNGSDLIETKRLLEDLKNTSEAEKSFLSLLNEKMNILYGIILYDRYPNKNTQENFDLLKSIAYLSGEVFDKKENDNGFKVLLQTSAKDSEHYQEKFDTFRMLRNLLVHFPIFDSWDDIYISRELLRWNGQHGMIEKYFEKNQGKTLSFSVYTRHDYFYDNSNEFSISIPRLKDKTKVYLKDMLSFNNALWLFALIGYYLEWKNYRIDPDKSYQGMVSA